ncbi:hypothetical protein DLE60_00145, partial [Micromonospora globispora]
MQLVAFAPPIWPATLRTLRKLTRLAVTALVLVVGAGGVAAAPDTTTALRPTVVTSRVAEPRPDAGVGTERVADVATEPAPGAPVERADRRDSASRPQIAVAVALADPGRDAV